MNLESGTTDTFQKYRKKKSNAIIQRNNVLCGKYIL